MFPRTVRWAPVRQGSCGEGHVPNGTFGPHSCRPWPRADTVPPASVVRALSVHTNNALDQRKDQVPDDLGRTRFRFRIRQPRVEVSQVPDTSMLHGVVVTQQPRELYRRPRTLRTRYKDKEEPEEVHVPAAWIDLPQVQTYVDDQEEDEDMDSTKAEVGSTASGGGDTWRLPPVTKDVMPSRKPSRASTRRRKKRDRSKKRDEDAESVGGIDLDASVDEGIGGISCRFPVLQGPEVGMGSSTVAKRKHKESNLNEMAINFRNSVEQLHLQGNVMDGKERLDRLLSESMVVDESAYDAFARRHKPEGRQETRLQIRSLNTPRILPRTSRGTKASRTREPAEPTEPTTVGPSVAPLEPPATQPSEEDSDPECLVTEGTLHLEALDGKRTDLYSEQRALRRPRHSKLRLALSRT